MKILILEDGEGLGREMEDAVTELNRLGHYTLVMDHCYENIGKIKILLSDNPDVIFTATTFTYFKKLPDLFVAANVLKNKKRNKKIEVWIFSYNSSLIFAYLPEELMKYFDFFDFNPYCLDTNGIEECKKRL